MMITDASPILASGLRFGLDHSTTPGLVICGILIVLSMVSWSVMLSKFRMLARSRKANLEFLRVYHDSPHPLAVFQMRKHYERAPLYHIYHAASRELAFHLLGTDEPDATFASRMRSAGRITPSQMKAVETAMDRAVSEASVKLESKMGAVALALSAAPFLGLLGTVWGVMDSFGMLTGAADGPALRAMAPGIYAALLTTVLALLVAIPSLFGYNLIVGQIRAQIVRLDHFASGFSSVLERHFVDHHTTGDELPSIGTLGTPNMPAFSGVTSQPHPKPAREMAASDV